MRVLQIGAGDWGSSWAEIVADAPPVELAGIVDLDPDALERAGGLAGVAPERRFRSIGDALARVEADAALVVVPPAAHAAVAIEALEAGLHTLVEKPFALSLADAEDAVRRAEDAGRVLMINQDQRHTRGARTVRRLLGEGALGRVGAISVRFSHSPVVRPFHLELTEPLLLDMVVHHLDQLRALGSEPDRVWARSFNPPWSPFPGNAAADALLEADGGETFVTYSGTWVPRGRDTSWTGEWEIQGEWGTILWDGDRVELLGADPGPQRRLRRTSGQRVRLDRVRAEGRLGSLAELVAAVTEGREPETSGRDNLRTLALVLAAVESARQRRPAELETRQAR